MYLSPKELMLLSFVIKNVLASNNNIIMKIIKWIKNNI
jgi:hypothetical protein